METNKLETMQKIKVENMRSPRSNKEVANQLMISDSNGVYFQSYKSIIAFIPFDKNKKTLLDPVYWDYSATTSKYRNEFLGEDKKETMRKLNEGIYEFANLN